MAFSTARSIALNAKDFGAKGDGASDDTDILQLLIDHAANRREEALIPSSNGSYRISKALLLPSNLRLRIEGTIQLLNASNCDILDFENGATNIKVYGSGTLDGNASAQNPSGPIGGIQNPFSGISDVRIRDLTITNVHDWPVNITNATDVIIQNAIFSYSGHSAEFAIACSDCHFLNCEAHHIADAGIAMYGGPSNSTILLCKSHDNGAQGIEVINDGSQPAACAGITIMGCQAWNNQYGGISTNSPGSGAQNRRIQIIGNNCWNNNLGGIGGTLPSGGIDLNGGEYIEITGNSCSENGTAAGGGTGIAIRAPASYVTVSHNTTLNNGMAAGKGLGIAVQGTAAQHDITIKDNICDDTQNPAWTQYQVVCFDSGSANIISTENYLGPTDGGGGLGGFANFTFIGPHTGPGIPTAPSVAGTSGGNFLYWQDQIGTTKRVVVYLNGYVNSSGAAQTLTYPMPFTYPPAISNPGSVPGISTTATALSLNPNDATAYTGYLVFEGF